MDYKTIITEVAKSLDPGLAINVSISSVEDLGDIHFVVADIHYPERDMSIPFIFNSDFDLFMPYDWEANLPTKANNINTTKWVRFYFF